MAKPNPRLMAPVPGMSLTGTPGNAPWEQPPKYTTIDEVIDYYSEKFTEEASIDKLMELVGQNVPIMDIINLVTRAGVMKGIHTVDTASIVTPVLVEIIKAIAEINGLRYVVQQSDIEQVSAVPEKLVDEVIANAKMKATEVKEDMPMRKGLMAKGE